MEYEVDTSMLDSVTESNYYMRVFHCLNPSGKLLAGQTLNLELIFSPMEEKRYLVRM